MSQREQDLDRLKSITSLIIDMDGVLYRGQERLRGAREFLAYLVGEDVTFILATNNSTLTPQQYVSKLAGMDIAVREDQILTSGQASALYLAEVAGQGTRVYAIGEDGLFAALEEQGFELTEEKAQYVVVGLDRRVTWDQLRIATLAIRAGATFIGTNPDTTLPTEEGLVPGTGAILAALEAATEVSPLVIGKPQPTLIELAMRRMCVERNGTAIVGDRLETDILGGKNAGIMTVLVLGGITQPDELKGSPYQPDFFFDGIGGFLQVWRDVRTG